MRGWGSVIQFTDQLFGHLRRADQRKWAHAYIEGLLSTPGKKSIRRLAATASESPTASQALHQFVNESPWEWTPACSQLRRWAEERARPEAWTIVPVVLPKRGNKSCGVHRRFIARTGRTVNCQLGTAVFMSTDAGAFPVGWNLFLPAQWAEGPRGEQARVPKEPAAAPEHAVLRLLDQLIGTSPYEDAPVVVDLEDHMDADRLLGGLNRRRRDFFVAVPDGFPLLSLGPSSRAPRRPETTAAGILRQYRSGPRSPAGRMGREGIRHSLVRLPGGDAAGRPPQPLRLFAGPGASAAEPESLWITTMVHLPVEKLSRYTDRRAAAHETVDLLERAYGLRDFEGRSFPGWHHHMTLVSAAFTYSRLATGADGRTARGPVAPGAEAPAVPAAVPRVLGLRERPEAGAPLSGIAPSVASPGNVLRHEPVSMVEWVTGPGHVSTRLHPLGDGVQAGGQVAPEQRDARPPHRPRVPGRLP